MDLAKSLSVELYLFDYKTRLGRLIVNNQQAIPLREQAMKALRESTTMLGVARNLLRQGNRDEAERLQHEARVKRDASFLLMAKANALENASRGEIRSHYHISENSLAH